jgi:hypothetical protein
VVADIERRVMDEHDRGPVGVAREGLLEPRTTLGAEDALPFSCDYRIESNKANRVILDHVVKKVAAPGQVSEVVERRADAAVPITIAGCQKEWGFKVGQYLAQVRILVRGTMMHAVACMNNRVHALVVDVRNTSPEGLGPRSSVRIIRRFGQNMRVADLSDNH